MITTVGKLDPPFGKTRLQVTKLFTAILQTNSEEANLELAKLGSLQVMWVSQYKIKSVQCRTMHM